MQDYGNDLRWQWTVWMAGKAQPLPEDAFRDERGAWMVPVPKGNFWVGSEDGDSDEQPVHQVEISAFDMDVYEVTNLQYRACVEAGTCDQPSASDSNSRTRYYEDRFYNDFPVIYVTWEVARTYCEEWRGARLPSEAEWEYAARGGLENMPYPWGDDAPECVPGVFNGANFNDCNLTDTMKVGTFAPNDYGLYDMAGNVWEWVSDWYSETYYQNYPADQWPSNPTGPEDGNSKVLRGGSWSSGGDNLRTSYRSGVNPSNYYYVVGFRCLRSP